MITLGKAGIIVNPEKFQFAKKCVEFAGFLVSENEIEPLPKYLDAISNFHTQKNVTDIRSWFGLANQVSNYAQLRDLMMPFKPFLSPCVAFSWIPELENKFKESREAIVAAIRKGVEIFDIAKRT